MRSGAADCSHGAAASAVTRQLDQPQYPPRAGLRRSIAFDLSADRLDEPVSVLLVRLLLGFGLCSRLTSGATSALASLAGIASLKQAKARNGGTMSGWGFPLAR